MISNRLGKHDVKKNRLRDAGSERAEDVLLLVLLDLQQDALALGDRRAKGGLHKSSKSELK